MDISEARDWFSCGNGPRMMLIPAPTLSGVARGGMPRLSRRPVKILSNRVAYWIQLQLPSREADLVYPLSFELEHAMRMKVSGAIGSGEVMGPPRTPMNWSRRAGQRRRIHPPGYFSIAFDMLHPIRLPFVSIHIDEDGMADIFVRKVVPPPPPQPPQPAPQAAPAA